MANETFLNIFQPGNDIRIGEGLGDWLGLGGDWGGAERLANETFLNIFQPGNDIRIGERLGDWLGLGGDWLMKLRNELRWNDGINPVATLSASGVMRLRNDEGFQ